MIYIRGLGKQKKGYKPTRKRKKKLLMFFFFFERVFHPMASVFNDCFLSSNQDTNRFLV